MTDLKNVFIVYEIVDNAAEANKTVDSYYLKKTGQVTEGPVFEEAKLWAPVKSVRYEEEDFVHDVKDSGTYESELHKYPRCIVVKDGHFLGFLLEFSDISSYGMSVNRTEQTGIVFIDGTSAGKTTRHYSHCSTEKDEVEDITYLAKKKSD